MNKNKILGIRITLYTIIVILLIIILYTKYAPKELDIWMANNIWVL